MKWSFFLKWKLKGLNLLRNKGKSIILNVSQDFLTNIFIVVKKKNTHTKFTEDKTKSQAKYNKDEDNSWGRGIISIFFLETLDG